MAAIGMNNTALNLSAFVMILAARGSSFSCSSASASAVRSSRVMGPDEPGDFDLAGPIADAAKLGVT